MNVIVPTKEEGEQYWLDITWFVISETHGDIHEYAENFR